MVSEVGSGSRFADSWRCRTAKLTSDSARLDVTAEVDRGGTVVDLVRQDGQFVVDPLSNREPMQLLEEWLRWRSPGALQNDTCCSVLHALQLWNTEYSSPAETVSGCTPVPSSGDGRCAGWPGRDNCTPWPLMPRDDRSIDDGPERLRGPSSRRPLADQLQRLSRTIKIIALLHRVH